MIGNIGSRKMNEDTIPFDPYLFNYCAFHQLACYPDEWIIARSMSTVPKVTQFTVP